MYSIEVDIPIYDKKGEIVSTETKLLKDLEKFQKALIEISVEIERITDKLNAIYSSLAYESEIDTKKETVNEKIASLKEALTERKHSNINKIFNSIIKEIIDTNALISLRLNNQGNIEFNADYLNKTDLLQTSEAQGTTYKKLLCVAFDISLLVNYSNNSFYKFVYHDGVLEGLNDRIKVRYINHIKQLCVENDLQCIITLIDSARDDYGIISRN